MTQKSTIIKIEVENASEQYKASLGHKLYAVFLLRATVLILWRPEQHFGYFEIPKLEFICHKNILFLPNAERYGSSIINDFNNGTVAWTDWNILLDQEGGPNHVGNFCFAPVHADTGSGELIFTPSYYYLGHFSKFIRPEAKRMSTAVSRSVLSSTSFINKDSKMVTVVMNKTDEEIAYNFFVGTNKYQFRSLHMLCNLLLIEGLMGLPI